MATLFSINKYSNSTTTTTTNTNTSKSCVYLCKGKGNVIVGATQNYIIIQYIYRSLDVI